MERVVGIGHRTDLNIVLLPVMEFALAEGLPIIEKIKKNGFMVKNNSKGSSLLLL